MQSHYTRTKKRRVKNQREYRCPLRPCWLPGPEDKRRGKEKSNPSTVKLPLGNLAPEKTEDLNFFQAEINTQSHQRVEEQQPGENQPTALVQ